jgi:broad specificity phosphatase PhoE
VSGSRRLALIRHAETSWVVEDRFQGRQDPPLSERGWRQARLVAERLGHRDRASLLPLPAAPPATIWHSPLERAAATAREIAADLPGVPLVASEALTEISAGDWEGRLDSEVATQDGERLAAWRRDPTSASAPGGEPLADAAARVRAGIEALLALLAGSPSSEPWAVVVAHDGILRLVVLDALELPLARFWSLPFGLCAVSVLEIRDGRASLRAHNLADHLAPLAADPLAAEEARGDRRGTL